MKKDELILFKQEIAYKFQELLISKEYKWAKWSGNLAKTTTVSVKKNVVVIEIPAPIYDTNKFFETGAIVSLNRGSYAEENDAFSGGLKKSYGGEKSGYTVLGGRRFSPSRNHLNFVERNILSSIGNICNMHNLKYEVVEGEK